MLTRTFLSKRIINSSTLRTLPKSGARTFAVMNKRGLQTGLKAANSSANLDMSGVG